MPNIGMPKKGHFQGIKISFFASFCLCDQISKKKRSFFHHFGVKIVKNWQF
jgi:hypothetical protein